MNNFSNPLPPPPKKTLSNTQNSCMTTSDSGIRMVLQEVLLLSYPSTGAPDGDSRNSNTLMKQVQLSMFYSELGGILQARKMAAPFELSSFSFYLFLSQRANLEIIRTTFTHLQT